jgi:hypothetical protein
MSALLAFSAGELKVLVVFAALLLLVILLALGYFGAQAASEYRRAGAAFWMSIGSVAVGLMLGSVVPYSSVFHWMGSTSEAIEAPETVAADLLLQIGLDTATRDVSLPTLYPGQTWEFSVDGGANWLKPKRGNRFVLDAGENPADVRVRILGAGGTFSHGGDPPAF